MSITSIGTYAAFLLTHNTHPRIPYSGHGVSFILFLSFVTPLTVNPDRPYQIKRRKL